MFLGGLRPTRAGYPNPQGVSTPAPTRARHTSTTSHDTGQTSSRWVTTTPPTQLSRQTRSSQRRPETPHHHGRRQAHLFVAGGEKDLRPIAVRPSNQPPRISLGWSSSHPRCRCESGDAADALWRGGVRLAEPLGSPRVSCRARHRGALVGSYGAVRRALQESDGGVVSE